MCKQITMHADNFGKVFVFVENLSVKDYKLCPREIFCLDEHLAEEIRLVTVQSIVAEATRRLNINHIVVHRL